MGVGRLCAVVACSFIAPAAWVRQTAVLTAKLLRGDGVCTKGALERGNPFIVLMV